MKLLLPNLSKWKTLNERELVAVTATATTGEEEEGGGLCCLFPEGESFGE